MPLAHRGAGGHARSVSLDRRQAQREVPHAGLVGQGRLPAGEPKAARAGVEPRLPQAKLVAVQVADHALERLEACRHAVRMGGAGHHPAHDAPDAATFQPMKRQWEPEPPGEVKPETALDGRQALLPAGTPPEWGRHRTYPRATKAAAC